MQRYISIGDHVRVSIANFFKKGTEPRYSDEIYTGEAVTGMTITLSDDKAYKRDKLLKIPKNTIKNTDSSHTVKPNVVKIATKERKIEIFHKHKGIEEKKLFTKKEMNY